MRLGTPTPKIQHIPSCCISKELLQVFFSPRLSWLVFMQHFYGKTGRPERLGKDHIIPIIIYIPENELLEEDDHLNIYHRTFFARFNLLQSLLPRCCAQCPSQDFSREFHLGRSSISDLISLDKMTTCLEITIFRDLVDPFSLQ